MKKTDLELHKGKKLATSGAPPDRFGRDSAAPADRRAQRERDRALGLVPFAVKLQSDLVRDLHAAAAGDPRGLNEVVAELLRQGLAARK